MARKRFRLEFRQRMYEIALGMHETLMREGSGRGMAYRRGWCGHRWNRTWNDYPIWRAGKDNRAAVDKANT